MASCNYFIRIIFNIILIDCTKEQMKKAMACAYKTVISHTSYTGCFFYRAHMPECVSFDMRPNCPCAPDIEHLFPIIDLSKI